MNRFSSFCKYQYCHHLRCPIQETLCGPPSSLEQQIATCISEKGDIHRRKTWERWILSVHLEFRSSCTWTDNLRKQTRESRPRRPKQRVSDILTSVKMQKTITNKQTNKLCSKALNRNCSCCYFFQLSNVLKLLSSSKFKQNSLMYNIGLIFDNS